MIAISDAGKSADMIDSTSYFVSRLLNHLDATQFLDRCGTCENSEQWKTIALQVTSFLEQVEALTASNANLLLMSKGPDIEISKWHQNFRWCLEQKSELDRKARSLVPLLQGFNNDNKPIR